MATQEEAEYKVESVALMWPPCVQTFTSCGCGKCAQLLCCFGDERWQGGGGPHDEAPYAGTMALHHARWSGMSLKSGSAAQRRASIQKGN